MMTAAVRECLRAAERRVAWRYDSYTLAKGIGYPLFLVLAKKLCLPYSVLLSLLQAAGAWLFVRAVSVRWQNPYGQAILYLLLLFSPISLTLLVTQRLYRMAIVPGMVLVVFSSMIGLHSAQRAPLEKTAALGIPDRTDSCLFLAESGRIPSGSCRLSPL